MRVTSDESSAVSDDAIDPAGTPEAEEYGVAAGADEGKAQSESHDGRNDGRVWDHVLGMADMMTGRVDLGRRESGADLSHPKLTADSWDAPEQGHAVFSRWKGVLLPRIDEELMRCFGLDGPGAQG